MGLEMISERGTLVRIGVLTFPLLLQIPQRWLIVFDRLAKGLLLESKKSRPSELFQLKIKKHITRMKLNSCILKEKGNFNHPPCALENSWINKYVNANSSHLRDGFVRGCPVLKLNCILKQLPHLTVHLAELESRNDLYSASNLSM